MSLLINALFAVKISFLQKRRRFFTEAVGLKDVMNVLHYPSVN